MRKASETSSSLPPGILRATFEVDRALADEFRLVAKRRERTFSGELRQLMREAIDRDKAEAEAEAEAA